MNGQPMTGAAIAQLIVVLGPTALDLISKLAKVWTTELSPDQVIELCAPAHKSYEAFIAEAKARLNPTTP